MLFGIVERAGSAASAHDESRRGADQGRRTGLENDSAEHGAA
jgi:hypothetical protein